MSLGCTYMKTTEGVDMDDPKRVRRIADGVVSYYASTMSAAVLTTTLRRGYYLSFDADGLYLTSYRLDTYVFQV